MPDHTYKLIELVGSSEVGIDEAIQNGIKRASQTIRNIDWFEVVSTRGQIEDGQIKYYQVTMKVGFRVLDKEDLR